jgi:LCP family protein required for cell wall assembly
MFSYRKLIPLLISAIFLQSCTLSGVSGITLTNSQNTSVSDHAYVIAGDDATATPTPFQPIPPTAIFSPTFTPLPSFTPLPPTATLHPTQRPISKSEQLIQISGQVNILLLGSDQRPWDVNFRTDTIVLATINPDLGTVNLTSFPRDLWVNLPDFGPQRINTAYYFGGIAELVKTFKQNFGVHPDHYVIIDFSSFKRIIDSVGGLDIKVTSALSDYRDGYWVTIPAGKVHMDADTVLWYVRSRKTTNDFARTNRQQEVLQALFDRLLSLDAIRRFPEFYAFYKDAVKTDLGFTDFLSMIPLGIKIAEDRSRIHHFFIGPKQVYNWITPEGAMVLVPVPEAVQEVIRKSQNLP